MTASAQLQQDSIEKLHDIFLEIGVFNIAVSGGIDSTLLAIISGRMKDVDATMIHALSPAVPKRATTRVRRYAQSENWKLRICNVGEFQDQNYLKNPVNRCFYCKSNLYGFIRSQFSNPTLSGANISDLSDYRPGLVAAQINEVRHPYIEAGIDKIQIRNISRSMNLDDLSELPASPCLSSRVETGIPIREDWLKVIDQLETEINAMINAKSIRFRIRKERVVLELDYETLNQINESKRLVIKEKIRQKCSAHGIELPVDFAEYRMGSAFLHSPA